jgi:hypothetical protein
VLGNWNFPCILLSAPNLSDSLFESICLNCGGKILCWEKWSGPVQARTTCTGVPFVVAKFSTRGIIIKPAQGLCYEYCCYITICMLFCNFIDDTVGERKLITKTLLEIFVKKRNLCHKLITRTNGKACLTCKDHDARC